MKSFNERIYEVCRKIPSGRVSTYKELANALNCKAYRAVGNAMNKNPYAPEVPCHRVVSSDGGIGGFASGSKNKIKMLKEENVFVVDGKIVDFEKKLFKFH
jgi:methylated-DNA-[protein]-cysteine S-methyltransferase